MLTEESSLPWVVMQEKIRIELRIKIEKLEKIAMQKKYVFLLFLGFLILSCHSANENIDCLDILISQVADQEVLAGTRSYVFLSAVDKDLTGIKYSIKKGPDFLSLHPTDAGRAEMIIDPDKNSLGDHPVKIYVNSGDKMGCIEFMIHVLPIKGKKTWCDPNRNIPGKGTKESPYGTLEKLLESGYTPKSNDVLLLLSGNHGNISIFGKGYSISAAANNKAFLNSLKIIDGTNISISGIQIIPEKSGAYNKEYIIDIDSLSSEISFRNNKIYSISNSDKWTVEDWNQKAVSGIRCKGNNNKIENTLFQNTFFAIKTEGDKNQVSYNHVDRFSGDAIRNTSSYNTYDNNFLTNATVDDYYDKDGNHDDLFQSWTFEDPIVGLKLFNNTMISCADIKMPLRSKIVQGLVCFDGFEKDWVVGDNLIVTDHPHGIALYGAENCTVHNNTVVKNPHRLFSFESDPWIMINSHKDGRLSKNITVRDNIVSAMNIVSKDVKLINNIIIDSMSINKYINYDRWNFKLEK